MPDLKVDDGLRAQRPDEALAYQRALAPLAGLRCPVMRLESYGNGQVVLAIQRGDRNELGDRARIVASSPAHLIEQLEAGAAARFRPGDRAVVVDMPAHAHFCNGTTVEILDTSSLAEEGTWAVRPVGDRDLSRAGFVCEEQLRKIEG